MSGLRVAELETLFTADLGPFKRDADAVEARQKQLDGARSTIQVQADGAMALREMDRVEAASRSLPDGELEVTADTSQAHGELDRLTDDAERAGKEGGDKGGAGLALGIVGALATIPIAGAVVGIGVAAGKALATAVQDGFAVEVRGDRLMAQTGLDPVTAAKIGRAAGDAYGNNWGESIEANFATARTAIQAGLIDPEATKRDAQKVIESLSGVADVIEDDIGKTARAVATLMRNDLAASADDAFDIIVKGQQAGLNVSEDWLDTINEYSVLWKRLGLTAPEAMGLMSQAVQGGARDTDKAADALKEFQIRATDASKLSAEGFRMLGLDAEEMTAKIARGGRDGAEGLAIVLQRLRETEDPVKRNAAAVALFGTQAEDLGDALFKMDLSNAVDQLGSVEGAARSALGVLTDNTQNDIDTAFRNIEVAADGVKGALAGAFGEPLEQFAGWVTENRAGIIQFLLDLANGGLDVGRAIINGIAGSTEAVGNFVGGPLASLTDALAGVLDGLSWAGFGVPGAQDGAKNLRDLAEGMRGFDADTEVAAATIRDTLITKGLDPLQDKLNTVGDQLVWDAEVHDAQVRLAKEIDGLGESADGSTTNIDLLNGKLDLGTEAGKSLAQQLLEVADGMLDQAQRAVDAGESTDSWTGSLGESYDALIAQLEAMGLTKEEAKALAAQYGAVPEDVSTRVSFDDYKARQRLAAFKDLLKIPDVVVTASLRAEGGYYANRGAGSIDVKRMAAGGVLSPIAQMVPPGTERIVGDRMDVNEAFIPLDGSPRSWEILMQALAMMPGGKRMADGGVLGSGPSAGGDTYYQFGDVIIGGDELPPEVREFFETLRERARRRKG